MRQQGRTQQQVTQQQGESEMTEHDQNTTQIPDGTTTERLIKNIRGLEDALDKRLYRAAGVWLIDIYEYFAILEFEANEYNKKGKEL